MRRKRETVSESNEVRNPRYAGATVGDLVRGLMRPRKPKQPEPAKEREETVDPDEDRGRFQRRRDGSPDTD